MKLFADEELVGANNSNYNQNGNPEKVVSSYNNTKSDFHQTDNRIVERYSDPK